MHHKEHRDCCVETESHRRVRERALCRSNLIVLQVSSPQWYPRISNKSNSKCHSIGGEIPEHIHDAKNIPCMIRTPHNSGKVACKFFSYFAGSTVQRTQRNPVLHSHPRLIGIVFFLTDSFEMCSFAKNARRLVCGENLAFVAKILPV